MSAFSGLGTGSSSGVIAPEIKTNTDEIKNDTNQLVTIEQTENTYLNTLINKIPADPAKESGHLAAIDTSTSNTANNTSTIVTNTGNIATNTLNTSNNTSTIVTNTGATATNTGTIVTNTGTTATNTGTTATNTGTIASNTGNIATNTGTTATNTTTIATNTGTTATNTGTIATNTTTTAGVSVADGANAPTNATQVGGVAGVPGVSAPTATTAGKAKRLWVGLLGEAVSRLVGPDGNDLFPSAGAPSDGVSNSENAPSIRSRLVGYNGSTWDRVRAGLNTVQTAFTGMLNTAPTGKYNATQPTLADTNGVILQVDSRGNLRTVNMSAPQAQDDLNQVMAVMARPLIGTTYTHTLYTYFAGAITKALILTGNRQAFSFTVTNRNAAVRYFGLHNKATAPAAGDAPLVVFMIPASSTLTIGNQFFTDAGINFSLGLGWAIGTTVATFTDAATASEHEVQVQYL